jgi:thiamine-phosphate pyrophosphorylase
MATTPTRNTSRWTRQLRGLYAITPDIVDITLLVAKVEAAIAGGAQIIQYRNKTAPQSLKRKQAAMLSRVCDGGGALFIVNDDVPRQRDTSAPRACIWARTTPKSVARVRRAARQC